MRPAIESAFLISGQRHKADLQENLTSDARSSSISMLLCTLTGHRQAWTNPESIYFICKEMLCRSV